MIWKRILYMCCGAFIHYTKHTQLLSASAAIAFIAFVVRNAMRCVCFFFLSFFHKIHFLFTV